MLSDRSGRLQAYLKKDPLGEEANTTASRRPWTSGDILWVEGTLFITKTGELTVEARAFRLLTKSIRPLPEKWHGLSDVETRYRQRYVDLIVNEEVREIFLTRNRIVSFLRDYLTPRDFLEVETPMMQPVAGGATAQPFITHHNALDMDLYLRIAPELYLKRLLVGGFERVFEINRNFRNEGIDTQHNPEFTMIEFYQAYATFEDLMALTEEHAFLAGEGTVRGHEVSLPGRGRRFHPSMGTHHRRAGRRRGTADVPEEKPVGGRIPERDGEGPPYPERGDGIPRETCWRPSTKRWRSAGSRARLRDRIPDRGLPPVPPERPTAGHRRPVRADRRGGGRSPTPSPS